MQKWPKKDENQSICWNMTVYTYVTRILRILVCVVFSCSPTNLKELCLLLLLDVVCGIVWRSVIMAENLFWEEHGGTFAWSKNPLSTTEIRSAVSMCNKHSSAFQGSSTNISLADMTYFRVIYVAIEFQRAIFSVILKQLLANVNLT